MSQDHIQTPETVQTPPMHGVNELTETASLAEVIDFPEGGRDHQAYLGAVERIKNSIGQTREDRFNEGIRQQTLRSSFGDSNPDIRATGKSERAWERLETFHQSPGTRKPQDIGHDLLRIIET